MSNYFQIPKILYIYIFIYVCMYVCMVAIMAALIINEVVFYINFS